ncbi:MAG: hypothetical protein GYA29_02675 [Methanothrix sp.]|nr:hypothetical protein [Methanothrix sp.]
MALNDDAYALKNLLAYHLSPGLPDYYHHESHLAMPTHSTPTGAARFRHMAVSIREERHPLAHGMSPRGHEGRPGQERQPPPA